MAIVNGPVALGLTVGRAYAACAIGLGKDQKKCSGMFRPQSRSPSTVRSLRVENVLGKSYNDEREKKIQAKNSAGEAIRTFRLRFLY